MKIEILAVGRLKNESPFHSLIHDYTKQLNNNLKITEIDERRFKNKDQQNQEIINKIPDSSYLIILDETGDDMPSRAFAHLIQKNARQDIIFVLSSGALMD